MRHVPSQVKSSHPVSSQVRSHLGADGHRVGLDAHCAQRAVLERALGGGGACIRLVVGTSQRRQGRQEREEREERRRWRRRRHTLVRGPGTKAYETSRTVCPPCVRAHSRPNCSRKLGEKSVPCAMRSVQCTRAQGATPRAERTGQRTARRHRAARPWARCLRTALAIRARRAVGQLALQHEQIVDHEWLVERQGVRDESHAREEQQHGDADGAERPTVGAIVELVCGDRAVGTARQAASSREQQGAESERATLEVDGSRISDARASDEVSRPWR
jgi:hypothetical protein